MPRRDELPLSLAQLATRQALVLSPARFRVDAAPLMSVLDKTLASQPGAPQPKLPPQPRPAHDSGRPPGAHAPVSWRAGPADVMTAPEQSGAEQRAGVTAGSRRGKARYTNCVVCGWRFTQPSGQAANLSRAGRSHSVVPTLSPGTPTPQAPPVMPTPPDA
jgi:hypothetical protein